MPSSNNLASTADALPKLVDNNSWLSPVSSIAQRLSDASFQTPKSKQTAAAAAAVTVDDTYCGQSLISDSVKFNFDDSSDSFHQFISNNASANPSCDTSFDSDWDLLNVAPEPASPCRPRALTFGSSPSAPLLDSARQSRQSQPTRRLLSVPIGASSPNRCRRRQLQGEKKPTKRPMPQESTSTSSTTSKASAECRSLTPKRRKLGDISNRQQQHQHQHQHPQLLFRCMSELSGLNANGRLDHAKVDKAIASIDSLNLIGNSSCCHSLPTVSELNYGIRYVTCNTISRLINGELMPNSNNNNNNSNPSFTIIDCRYPYEFNGGHIKGAVNIYRHEDLLDRILKPASVSGNGGGGGGKSSKEKPALIFHCEFSSERAPKLARFLRQRDREVNSLNYPDLYFPEVYVLQGGYKAFYESYKSDCHPSHYTKMSDPVHKHDLSRFQKLGKAWERQNSRSRQCKLQRHVCVQ